jgi:hypothetical protein
LIYINKNLFGQVLDKEINRFIAGGKSISLEGLNFNRDSGGLDWLKPGYIRNW